ncbi:MAG: hypothetical protein MI921_21545, partial [Cytophagales bacterium]|nr:hypothetical protein [Cytophagales bacterium]
PEDLVHMKIANIFVVACSNRTLNFYETRSFSLCGRLRPLTHPPQCLPYGFLKDEDTELIPPAGHLTVYSKEGRIFVYNLHWME